MLEPRPESRSHSQNQHRLSGLSGPDWETRRCTTVILPVGSTEQHGPHLPMGTDTAIADAVAEMAARLSPEIVVAPAIPYGMSRHHDRLPGRSVSLPPRILIDVLIAVVTDLLRDGSGRAVIVLNGHGGNWTSIACALDELGGERGELPVAACSWWDLVPDLVTSHNLPGEHRVSHAGLIETSVMLGLFPEQVLLERTGSLRTPAESIWDDPLPHPAHLWQDFADIHASGVTGSPAGASAAFGQQLVETSARRLCELASVLMERKFPAATDLRAGAAPPCAT